jgi:hypothetical protein
MENLQEIPKIDGLEVGFIPFDHYSDTYYFRNPDAFKRYNRRFYSLLAYKQTSLFMPADFAQLPPSSVGDLLGATPSQEITCDKDLNISAFACSDIHAQAGRAGDAEAEIKSPRTITSGLLSHGETLS